MLTDADKAEVLRHTALFAGIDGEALAALAKVAVEKIYPKNATVLVQDEPGDRLFVIVSGGVRVVRQSPAGERLELLRRREHQSFGELALLDGGPRTASVETTQPTTLLALSREVILALLQQRPTLVPSFLVVVARTVREANARESDLVFLDLKGRLARRLLELSADTSEPHALSRANRVTQSELAQMVGASRQRVHAALHAFAKAGHIELHETGISVLSRDGLQTEVGPR